MINMKCINCGMGFIVTDYNKNLECPHCGHIHGADYVEHTHEDGVVHTHKNGDVPHTHEEKSMIKKIKNKIKSIWNKIVSLFKPKAQ
jgi:transcription elongation factor Elf1